MSKVDWQHEVCREVHKAGEIPLHEHLSEVHGVDTVDGTYRQLQALHGSLNICTVVSDGDAEPDWAPLAHAYMTPQREKWTFVGRIATGWGHRYLWRQQYGGQCWRDVDTFWVKP